MPSAFARALPSGRLLLAGFGLLALAVSAYAGARETAVFAVERVDVRGPRPFVVHRVEAALEPLAGESLLTVDRAAIDRRLAALPDVRLVSYDRAFPHTARIVVDGERPVAVLRRRSEAWLLSERGRVLRSLADSSSSSLPRIWVGSATVPREGSILSDEQGLEPALALGTILSTDPHFLRLLKAARAADGELVLVLRSGDEIRLGTSDDLPLKIAVVERMLSVVGEGGAAYFDVSVPERPVALTKSQVES